MKTYNDLLKNMQSEKQMKEFLLATIKDHKSSPEYKTACDANMYIRQLNVTIMEYTKILHSVNGKAFPDPYSANHKTASNFFKRFITQEIEYLLANGVEFQKPETKKKLGGVKFDRALKKAAKYALLGGKSYGFWNYDKLIPLSITDFAPLLDEDDGAIKAGIRFWQIANNKPLRVTFYELDGYTDYIQENGKELEELRLKQPYKVNFAKSQIDGVEIYGGENYPTFPIVPLFGNDEHQSELVGLRTEIDCFDLVKSGLANDMEDVGEVYWLLQNAGGMSEQDLAKFVNRVKTLRVAQVEDEAQAQLQTVEIPYQARETYLQRLENDMYYDAMSMNAKDITAGNVTATAIRAAYDNLDQKAAELRGCIEEFLENLFEIVGIEDTPKFKINRISNETEYNQNVLAAAEYLDHETILKKLTFVEPEEIMGILERTAVEQMDMTEPGEGEQIVQPKESNSEVGATESGD